MPKKIAAKKPKRNPTKNAANAPATAVRESHVTYGATVLRGHEMPRQMTIKSDPSDFRSVRNSLGVTQHEMCALSGISIRKISGMETGEQKPTRDDVRRFNELRRLRTELTHILEADAIGDWLQESNEYFGGLSPLQVIERGESDRLWRMIWRVQDGVPLD